MHPPPSGSSGPGHATALWLAAAGAYALRSEPLPQPGHAEVMVTALYSAVSRGTERLVMDGNVPESEAERMRCPHQSGTFPFPVKYGYALVGEAEGRTVFVLHPHQSAAIVPRSAVVPVPDAVPPRRATLAASMETALNVIWDAGVAPGDRVLVVGAGVVGLLVARLCARMPGVEATVTDIVAGKQDAAEAMGAAFGIAEEVDVAINASGHDGGLRTAIEAAGLEGRVVEASWHGVGSSTLPLGGAFHSRRLTIVSSQVGRIPADHAARWTFARRLRAAMALLADDALDRLLTHDVALAEAPARLPELMRHGGALGITITYPPFTSPRGA